MDYFQLLESIRNNNIPPVIFMYGEGTYFIQKIKHALQNQLVEKDFENLSTYDLEETPIEDVITDVETYPFFSDQKLIFAENPTFLLSRSPKLPFEHQLDFLERYLSSPVDYSVLVITAPYEKIDQRKKITRLLKKHSLFIKFDHIKERDMRKWINQFAKLHNLTIEPEAMTYIENHVTIDLELLENEMKKLSLYVKEDGVITREIAEKVLSQTIDSSALSLVDAVIEKDYEKSLFIFKELSIMKESSIGLIALLSHQFRMILQVKLLKKKGYNKYQIQRNIGAHPYVIKLASERERMFSLEALQRIIDQLTEVDAQIKTGKLEESIAVELLLYQLIIH